MSSRQEQVEKLLGNKKGLSELKSRILFVIGALIIYRMGTFLPVPGVNPQAMTALLDQNSGGLLDMFNMFSGGALGRYSIFALGVMPYITASIIMQILGHTVPALRELKKEGETGRRKTTQYTRYFTIILAVVQSFSITSALQGFNAAGGVPVVPNPGFGFLFTATVSLTGGTMFLMWLGEQITERGIGNGISLIIFAGIVVGLPSAIVSVFQLVGEGQLNAMWALLLLVLALALTAFIVFVERGQRRITMQFARRGGRQATQAQTSYLPLKVNMSGVIPVIFASSLVLFPGTIASFLGQSEGFEWLTDLSQQLQPGNTLYMIFFGVLIVGFAFFYTALTFNADETADNLKRQSAVIPGIRPGKQTSAYLDGVLTRVTFWGALYLLGVSLLPDFIRTFVEVPFAIGGTGLLIVVVVAMDFMAQLQNHLVSQQYDSVLKKSNIKNYRRSNKIRR
ncbi:preprotein translocase subunit SecY [Marinicella sp. S1101]|uniref:preprotein translocase subunit SecY n=1 Tax=Marinicella marina TaxID=2996016 RepID=UPI002260948F|nr:preprotein translocase subunit SecY [Marinicella marina]MCX7555108.1 preprotein translocase subunit SecY [Marinicella marina]MDJ1140317.1 preprotein translocase subunit SecY [Marinicella marina]